MLARGRKTNIPRRLRLTRSRPVGVGSSAVEQDLLPDIMSGEVR